MRLFEQYRPQSWPELIGQERAVAKINILRRRGLGGRCYWISGPSGTGKTSLAYLIAGELADRISWAEMSADEVTPAWLDSVKQTIRLYGGLWGSGKHGKAYIVNEAHGLSASAVRRLLDMLEHGLPEHVVWLYTTTLDGMERFEDRNIDAQAFLSRCTEIKLTNQGLAQKIAVKARQVAQKHGLDGKPPSAYLQLARDCGNNFRRVYEEIETGAMLL